MTEHTGYVKARIKTYEQLVKVYPEARHWGKPVSLDHLFPSADEVIIPYLGKTVWVRKIWVDLCSFYYEVQDIRAQLGWVNPVFRMCIRG